MKRILVLILMMLCLAGCAKPSDKKVLPTDSATVSTEWEEETAAPTGQATIPDATNATIQTTEPESEQTILQKIRRIDQPIYEGPSYDAPLVGNIGETGTFTITETAEDESGNLWGKLKSGIGWVDLTQIWAEEENPPVITASYADLRLMQDREFEQFTVDAGEFSLKAAICAHKDIQNIEFYAMGLVEGEEDQLLFTLSECKAGAFFVIDIAFPGDMTAYRICFTDSDGKDYRFVLTDSGRGGLWLA